LNRDEIIKPKGLFIVVSAPSGTGKTSICREVLRSYPDIRFSISYTTRPPRPGEVDGKDYFFISETDFRQRINGGDFAEWAENYGYYYGTSKKTMTSFLESGYDLILDIEPAGARTLKKSFSFGVFVFILPPSLDELKMRLQRRGFEDEEAMCRRLNRALNEVKEVEWYDYVIFNENLDEAIGQLKSIYIAEKSRRERLEEKIKVFFKPMEVC
jgi:guanylate kinase